MFGLGTVEMIVLAIVFASVISFLFGRSRSTRIKNLSPCPDCHALVSNRATVCLKCGSPLDMANRLPDRPDSDNPYQSPHVKR